MTQPGQSAIYNSLAVHWFRKRFQGCAHIRGSVTLRTSRYVACCTFFCLSVRAERGQSMSFGHHRQAKRSATSSNRAAVLLNAADKAANLHTFALTSGCHARILKATFMAKFSTLYKVVSDGRVVPQAHHQMSGLVLSAIEAVSLALHSLCCNSACSSMHDASNLVEGSGDGQARSSLHCQFIFKGYHCGVRMLHGSHCACSAAIQCT